MKGNKPAGWQNFLELCKKMDSTEELENCFQLFFTLEEQNVLAARYLIIKELLDNCLTQREIAQLHQVSIAQITRGSNALKALSPYLNAFFIEKIT